MRTLIWNHREDPASQAEALAAAASETGFVVVEFSAGGDGSGLHWGALEPWTRSRAVTIAVLGGAVASPALDVALCSDLVYVQPSARLRLTCGPGVPSPGVIWALGRAGRRALARGLLATAELDPGEAVNVGVAHGIVRDRAGVPVPEGASLTAATTARDLLRSQVPGSPGLALELAAFRLLFAAGDPGEGALAFLEKRDPSF